MAVICSKCRRKEKDSRLDLKQHVSSYDYQAVPARTPTDFANKNMSEKIVPIATDFLSCAIKFWITLAIKNLCATYLETDRL